MKKNEISAKLLNAGAQNWIKQLRQVMLIQDKGKGTIKSYTAEMILQYYVSAKRPKQSRSPDLCKRK